MFCERCGTQNPETAKYCRNCGAELKKSNNRKPTFTVPNHSTPKNIGMIAVIAAVLVVVLLGVGLFGGRSYKTTIKKYVKASFAADTETIVKLFPDKVIKYALEESDYDVEDFQDLKYELSEQLQDQMSTLDDYMGEGWKFSYEITNDEIVEGDDLDDIKKGYEEANFKISAARNVEIEISIKGDKNEETVPMEIALIKSGRNWYLDALNFADIF